MLMQVLTLSHIYCKGFPSVYVCLINTNAVFDILTVLFYVTKYQNILLYDFCLCCDSWNYFPHRNYINTHIYFLLLIFWFYVMLYIFDIQNSF